MALTLALMRAMVVEQLHPAIKAQSTYSTTVVDKYINRGYHDFNRRCFCIKDNLDITTVANQLSYTSTDNASLAYVRLPYEVRYITSGSTDIGYKLAPYPGGHAALPRVKSYGIPQYYWTLGVDAQGEFQIGTWPVVSGASNTIRLWSYNWVTTELSSDSDQPLLKEAYRDAPVYFALSRINKMFSWMTTQNFAAEANMNWQMYIDLVQDYMQNMAVNTADHYQTTFNTEEEDW